MFHRLKVSQLKDELRARGLRVNGNKGELLERLESYQDGGNKRPLVDVEHERKRQRIESEAEVSLSRMFDRYCKEEECIGMEGVLSLCEDIRVSPEDPVMIVISWFCEANQLGEFSRTEFKLGMGKIGCCSVEELGMKVDQLRKYITVPGADWEDIYKFAYGWACEPSQKSISKEAALGLWPIFLEPLGFSVLDVFLRFVGKTGARGITKDTWVQTLAFVKYFKRNGNTLADDMENAWPVLIDDFIEFYNKQGI